MLSTYIQHAKYKYRLYICVLIYINLRENWRSSQQWTIQKLWHHWEFFTFETEYHREYFNFITCLYWIITPLRSFVVLCHSSDLINSFVHAEFTWLINFMSRHFVTMGHMFCVYKQLLDYMAAGISHLLHLI
jgi:hypothetical protein